MILEYYLIFCLMSLLTMGIVIVGFIGYDIIRDIISKYSSDGI